MKKEYFLPVIILLIICLVVSGALAVSNNLTRPVIEAAAVERANAARKSIIPDADGFELLNMESLRNESSWPRRITEVYRTTNNTGFIFMITSTGYGGDIKYICGIDMNGKVINTTTLGQSETQGLGTKIFAEGHSGQYKGKDAYGIEDVEAVSGATITSNAFKNGIRDAFAAFEIVRTH